MTVAARKPNPIEQRRAQNARRQKERKREAKLGALSDKTRATLEAREAVQAAAKSKRTAEGRAKLRADSIRRGPRVLLRQGVCLL